jgi:hypothetical protein
LNQLLHFIHGDLYHCAVCSSRFEEPSNLPRVLFCGDCLCERCLRSSIQPKALSSTDKSKREAAGQLTCLVCQQVHIFKMTRNGFVICNEKFVKVRDDHGLVNLNGNKVKYREEDLKRAIDQRQMMDNSINIPVDLIIRSLPINVELIELIREQKYQEQQERSILNHIGKFIHLDKLDDKDAKYYMQELKKICDEDV